MEWREGGRTYKGYTTFYWGVHYFSRLPIVWRAIEWAKMMLSTAGSRNALMARQIALNYRHHAFHSVPYIHTYLYTYILLFILTAGYEENFPCFTHFSLIVAWPPEVKTWVAKVLRHYSRWNLSSKRFHHSGHGRPSTTAFTSHEYSE